MNSADLAKRVIVAKIEKCAKCRKAKHAHKLESHPLELKRSLYSKGWHAFRRGLAATLHRLGASDKEIGGDPQTQQRRHHPSELHQMDREKLSKCAAISSPLRWQKTNPATEVKGLVN